MKKLLFVLGAVVLFTSCLRTDNNKKVSISYKNDTIKDGEIFHAELFVPSSDSILPNFFIVRDLDTFRLPIDETKRCAVFQAVGRGTGEKKYKGYVEYIDIKGNPKKLDFKITFVVKK